MAILRPVDPKRRKARGEIVLRAVHPNAGVEAEYRRRLTALVEDMHKSVLFWVKAAYRSNPPKMAQDESAATVLRRAIDKLTKRWFARFDEAAESLADYFATASAQRSDATLKRILKDSGFSVEWKMTPAQREVMQATVQQSVGLIRSIPERYLGQVETLVMQSVQTGRDLGQLTADLQKQFGVTKRRAAFIARSQNNLATASLTKARYLEIGVDRARWCHSHGGRTKRRSHVKASEDRVEYDVHDGWYDPDEGKRIMPGELPNCRCFARAVVKGFM